MDTKGPTKKYCKYDAYGKVTITARGTDALWYTADDVTLATSAYHNPFAFTGRQLDILDGGALHHMHCRHRDYSPRLGRFTQHDPLGINPGYSNLNPFGLVNQYYEGLNIYEYVQSEPIGNSDHLGLSSCYDDLLVCEEYCNDCAIVCNRDCMKYKKKIWYNYARCEAKCQTGFMVCSTGCDAVYTACIAKEGAKIVCEVVIGAGELIFDTLEDAARYLAEHPRLVIGTTVVVAGVIMVVTLGPAGVLVLSAA